MAVDYLNALGASGSGLNIRQLTTSLVEADTAPRRAAAEKRIEAADVSISALGKVRAQFETLSGAIGVVTQSSVLKATSSSSALAVTVTDKALVSDSATSIEVLQMAQRQVIEFSGFTAADAPLAAGRITVDFGVWYAPEGEEVATNFAANPDLPASSIDVGDGATLQDLATALSSIPGVTARVLDKGDGTFSLGVISEPGAGSALRFGVTETVSGSGLARFDTTASNADVEIQAATDAVLTVDGITVSRGSNEIDDLLPGASLTISGTTSDAATVRFSRDTETAEAAMTYLVEELNATLSLLGQLTLRATDGSDSGDLAGDRMVEGMRRELAALISRPLNGHGEKPVYLSQLGVSTNRDGSLRFDADAFQTAFAEQPALFDAIFANSFTSPQAGVSVTGVLSGSAPSGEFAFRRDAVTGEATVDGAATLALPAEDGRSRYLVLSGRLSGLLVTVEPDVTDATVRFGRSLASSLQGLLEGALATNGAISERETQIKAGVEAQNAILESLDTREGKLEQRYLAQFTAMEQAVSRMKSTGTYLENLIAAWHADD
ncbi:flagellar filament capping protein FliD [Cereibacter sphaeroides]|uniref:flagellar filament capping protein FliD n=1 Tax=Cereibacter sphaeroides TaxID=1063 RepID=UPI001F3EDD51|nr:flagellar filament capping protein FliD [Cereibacter sphaeroides]MCE6953001.1 flagellar filament capping protein FliD [Cereibacter sphaeroides]